MLFSLFISLLIAHAQAESSSHEAPSGHEAPASEHHAAESGHGEKAHEEKPSGYLVEVREQGQEFQFPAKIWDLMLEDSSKPKAEAAGGGHGKGKAEKAAEGDSDMQMASFIYSRVDVVLKEKTSGVLKKPEIRIQLPDGGGEVDLAKWTTGQVGSFFVNFEWDGKKEGAEDSKVLFQSRARKRRVGDDLIGAGCKKVLQLTKNLVQNKKFEGLKVNTSRDFHTSVLGGHFFFSWKNEGVRKITRVSFKDSSRPDLFCGVEP